jgi:hypothetical protein
MKRFFLILSVLLLFLPSCSSPRNTLNRLYRDYPELFNCDTLRVKTFVPVDGHSFFDSAILKLKQNRIENKTFVVFPDTALIFSDNKIKANIALHTNTATGDATNSVEMQRLPDSIEVENTLIVDHSVKNIVEKTGFFEGAIHVFLALAVLFFVILTFYLLIKSGKK